MKLKHHARRLKQRLSRRTRIYASEEELFAAVRRRLAKARVRNARKARLWHAPLSGPEKELLAGVTTSGAFTLEATIGMYADVRRISDGLLASGSLLDRETFCSKSGMTSVQLDRAIADGRLFVAEVGGIRGYPAFYLDAELLREEIEAVIAQLGDAPGGAKWLFFERPKGSLAKASDEVPRTPLEALRAGEFDRVMQTARGFAEQG